MFGGVNKMVRGLDPLLISQRIIQARTKLGINQAQLAKKAGITPAAISQIENGKRMPTTPVLHRIAEVLEVSLDYLTGRSDESRLEDLVGCAGVERFFRGVQSLDERDRDTIMKHIEFLRSEAKKKKKK